MRRIAIAGLVPCLFALAACGGPHGATGTIASVRPNSYSFRCGPTPSPNDWAAELNGVKPQQPIGDTLPVTLSPAGADKASQCGHAMLEARVEAIRRTGLFRSVQVAEAVGDMRPDGMTGFALWTEGNSLVVAYGQGVRMLLEPNGQRLDAWAAGLKPFFEQARTAGESTSMNLSLTSVGTSNYYGFKGKEYISLVDLRAALLEDAHAIARTVTPVRQEGRTLLIVIPTETSLDETWNKSASGAPVHAVNLGLALAASAYAHTVGQAEAIKQSGLFQHTDIEQKDVTDLDNGAYDAVIWTEGTNGSRWYMRLKGHDALPFRTFVTQEPDKWLAVVLEAVAKSKARPM